MAPFTLLYVDDEPDLLELGKAFLESTGDFIIDSRESARAGLAALSTGRYDAVISDCLMPEMDGIAFLKAVRSKLGNVPFILFTGRGREEVMIDAINNGVDFYLQKGGGCKVAVCRAHPQDPPVGGPEECGAPRCRIRETACRSHRFPARCHLCH